MRSKTVSRQSSGVKKKKRKKNKGFGCFIFTIVIIVVLVIGGIAAYKYFTRDNYDSEKSFERYAKKYFKEVVESDDIGDEKTEYDYGEHVATAIQYPEIGLENADARTQAIIKEVQDGFKSKYGKNSNGKAALLIACDTYKGDQDTGSVVVKTSVKEENDKGDMTQVSSSVKTFTFNRENGAEIFSLMAFESGYQDKLTKFLKDEGYDKAGSEGISYDNFALSGKNAIFFFDAGKMDDSTLVKGIKVKPRDVEGMFRDEIKARSLDPSKPMVAITYDDGPNGKTTPKILDILEKNGAVATFFELGQNVDNVSNSKELLERMLELNCEVGSHSYNHPNMFQISDAAIKEQNEKTDKAIESKIGQKPTVYRPPYGNGNEKTTKIFGKPGILWSIDTEDWKSRNAASVVNVIKKSGNLDGKVILMHSIYDSTAQATEEILPWLQSQGYQTVTMSELLMYKYKEDPAQAKFYGYNYFYLQ